MQPHVHANSRRTRIIPPLSCSTTMQGPAHAHDRHMLPARQHQPCGTGYKGLQRATQYANSPPPIQQNATGQQFTLGAILSPSPAR